MAGKSERRVKDLVQKSVSETRESIMVYQDKLNNIVMYIVEVSNSDSAIERNNKDFTIV